jgi:hypothetical protein
VIPTKLPAASEREKAIATGCDEFDAKPIEFESLVGAFSTAALLRN